MQIPAFQKHAATMSTSPHDITTKKTNIYKRITYGTIENCGDGFLTRWYSIAEITVGDADIDSRT